MYGSSSAFLMVIFVALKGSKLFFNTYKYTNTRKLWYCGMDRTDFSDQFRKIMIRYKRIVYNLNVMRQSVCLLFDPITVAMLHSLIARRWVGSGVRLYDGPDLKL